MKTYYAVHSDKTHVKVESLVDFVARFSTESDWKMVEADDEGWIAHTGRECPLPGGVKCEVRTKKTWGGYYYAREACDWDWDHDCNAITHYRPILAEKVQEPEPIPLNLTTNTLDLLGTLSRAHEHAQTIPDLEAELREVLAGMGYDLVKRSPFVEPEAAVETAQIKIDWPPCNPGCDEDFNGYRTKLCSCAPAKESVQKQTKPTEDMTDWRNWREGDLIEVVGAVDSYWQRFYPVGSIATVVTDNDGDFGVGDTKGAVISWGRFGHKRFKPECFRFHSRPAKREK